MDLLNGMLQKDQDEFRRICNKLINVCFICRQNQATRSDFYFIQKYKEKFEEWFGGNIDNKMFESAITFWFKDVDFDGDKVWEYFHMNN